MDNYLLEIDSFEPAEIYSLINSFDDKSFTLLAKGSYNNFKNIFSKKANVFVKGYDSFLNTSNLTIKPLPIYKEILDIVVNDVNSMLFRDRFGMFPKRGIGVMHYLRYINIFVWNAISFLKENNFEFIYFRNTPHTIEEWILARVAEYLNVKILVTERYVLPWRYAIFAGFGKYRDVLLIEGLYPKTLNEKEVDLLDSFIKLNNKSYEKAIPSYEKNRLGKSIFKYYNPFKDISRFYQRPDLIINKYLCYKAYQSYSIEPNLENKYICFFLHYQPERTSLPEGYGFTQQLTAIIELRQATPKCISIYVKEHPSIFTNYCGVKERHPTFYKDINAIEGVQSIALDTDTFKLIDYSIATATLTGTVGLQSILRNRPVIFFGRTLMNFSGVHQYTSYDELLTFIKLITNIKIDVKKNAVLFLKQILYNSVTGINNYKGNIDVHSSKSIQQNAHLRLLEKIICQDVKKSHKAETG